MGELRQETEGVSARSHWMATGHGPRLDPHQLMLMSHWQNEGDEATQNQGCHLQAAETSPSSGVGFVAVPQSAHLREDMYCGNVKKGPGREKHGHSSGIDLWKGFFTALWREREKKIKPSNMQSQKEE